MEEDRRREAAISSTPSLQPNFKPVSGVSHAQLSKFHELHKRRLQLKSKSDKTKKSKVNKRRKSPMKELSSDRCGDETSSKKLEDSNVPDSNASSNITPNVSTLDLDNDIVTAATILKKRQKLHWGLDTKNRWEMKSNM